MEVIRNVNGKSEILSYYGKLINNKYPDKRLSQ